MLLIFSYPILRKVIVTANKTIREYLEYIRPMINESDFKNISGNKLFEILRQRNILIESDGFNNVPNNIMQHEGLLTGEKKFYDESNKWNYKLLITDKGTEWITKGLIQYNFISLIDKPLNYIKCDFQWIINNIDDTKYLIQYKNYNDIWCVLSGKSSKLSTLINIKKNNSECRYYLKGANKAL